MAALIHDAAYLLLSMVVLALAIFELWNYQSLLAKLIFGILTLVGVCSTMVSAVILVMCRKDR